MTPRLASAADAGALRRALERAGDAGVGDAGAGNAGAGGASAGDAGGGLGGLERELARPDRLWALAEEGGEARAFLALELEPELRLAKLRRLRAAGAPDGGRAACAELLRWVLADARAASGLDVVYSTTRTLSHEEQAATLDCGFQLLAVFPNAASLDPRRVDGLSAWFAPGVLERKRHAGFALHPAAAPVFEAARGRCGLPPLPLASPPEPPAAGAPAPELELIEAPRLAAARFARLRESRGLSVNFYPFHEADAFFASADESVEVFAALSRELRFASLLGERLGGRHRRLGGRHRRLGEGATGASGGATGASGGATGASGGATGASGGATGAWGAPPAPGERRRRPGAAVDPVALYRRVGSMLRDRRFRFVEIINDAADALGLECLLGAGFSPCGYFPCLRLAGGVRRDYVILGRSLEPFRPRPLPDDPRYRELLEAFLRSQGALAPEPSAAELDLGMGPPA